MLGRRVSRTYNSVTTTYVWDGAHIIAEYTDGSLTKKYVYGPGMDNPVAMINVDAGSNETWYYYYADAQGSIRLMTDSAGNIVESYTYLTYGQPYVITSAGADNNWLTEDGGTLSTSSSIGNPYRFTGRRWDENANIYYYRFRDYSPFIGRFLQTDPLGYIDTMNVYAYCGNNPTSWIDPWGLLKDDIKMIKGIVKSLNLTDDGARLLHDTITGQGLSRAQIIAEGKAIQQMGGKYVVGQGATKSGWIKGGTAMAVFGWVLTISQECGANDIIMNDDMLPYDMSIAPTGFHPDSEFQLLVTLLGFNKAMLWVNEGKTLEDLLDPQSEVVTKSNG